MTLQVGVKILLKSGSDKYLFLKRAESFKPGVQKWDIPGGRINVDETLDDALAREVYEETALKIDSYELLAAQDIFVEDKDLHVVRLTYIGKAIGDEITISDEHSEYKWMTKQQVINEPLDKYLMQLIDKF